MSKKIELLTQKDVGERMAKRTRLVITPKLGGKRICVKDPPSRHLTVEETVLDVGMREALVARLAALRECTTLRSGDDPRLLLNRLPRRTCEKLSTTVGDLIAAHPNRAQLKQLTFEADTWRLLAALLEETRSARIAVLNWVQEIAKRCVYDAQEQCRGMEPKEKFLRVLGWLVVGNLNLDAARLAAAEDEIDLAQVLMCRQLPGVMTRLMRNYVDSRHRPGMHPMLRMILDLLAGNGDALLDELNVDWRLRLASKMMSGSQLEGVLQEVSASYGGSDVEEDLQFLILRFFACVQTEDIDVSRDVLSKVQGTELLPVSELQSVQILQLDTSSVSLHDVCLKWQLCIVMSAAGVITQENRPEDTICQLYHTMCDGCEDLALPEWSLFVVLNQSLPLSLVEMQAERVLGMYTSTWIQDVQKESFLRNDLKLPLKWIVRAKACWYKETHQVENEMHCLMAIDAVEEAHDVLFQKVLPKTICSTASLNLESVLSVLKEKRLVELQHRIERWQLGGGLLAAVDRWLRKNRVGSVQHCSSVLTELGHLERRILVAKKLWSNRADSDRERRSIQRMHDLLSYHLELHYSKLFGQEHGDQYIMTRILKEKCRTKAEMLSYQI